MGLRKLFDRKPKGAPAEAGEAAHPAVLPAPSPNPVPPLSAPAPASASTSAGSSSRLNISEDALPKPPHSPRGDRKDSASGIDVHVPIPSHNENSPTPPPTTASLTHTLFSAHRPPTPAAASEEVVANIPGKILPQHIQDAYHGFRTNPDTKQILDDLEKTDQRNINERLKKQVQILLNQLSLLRHQAETVFMQAFGYDEKTYKEDVHALEGKIRSKKYQPKSKKIKSVFPSAKSFDDFRQCFLDVCKLIELLNEGAHKKPRIDMTPLLLQTTYEDLLKLDITQNILTFIQSKEKISQLKRKKALGLRLKLQALSHQLQLFKIMAENYFIKAYMGKEKELNKPSEDISKKIKDVDYASSRGLKKLFDKEDAFTQFRIFYTRLEDQLNKIHASADYINQLHHFTTAEEEVGKTSEEDESPRVEIARDGSSSGSSREGDDRTYTHLGSRKDKLWYTDALAKFAIKLYSAEKMYQPTSFTSRKSQHLIEHLNCNDFNRGNKQTEVRKFIFVTQKAGRLKEIMEALQFAATEKEYQQTVWFDGDFLKELPVIYAKKCKDQSFCGLGIRRSESSKALIDFIKLPKTEVSDTEKDIACKAFLIRMERRNKDDSRLVQLLYAELKNNYESMLSPRLRRP